MYEQEITESAPAASSPEDDKPVQTAVLRIGLGLYLLLFIAVCVYSRVKGVYFYLHAPFCFLPAAVLGLSSGVFSGSAKPFKSQLKEMGYFLIFIMLIELAAELIRAVVIGGFSALSDILDIFSNAVDNSNSVVEYGGLNLLMEIPVTAVTMFVGLLAGIRIYKAHNTAEE